jgi:hypothetical protein
MHEFRKAVESQNFDAVPALLADDAVFRSPVLFMPFEGKNYVAAVLLAAFRTLEDFRYERELSSDDGRDHALVFRARVGDKEIHGCDFIHENEDGMIDEFTVMLRPMSAVQAMGEAMIAAIEAAKGDLGVA